MFRVPGGSTLPPPVRVHPRECCLNPPLRRKPRGRNGYDMTFTTAYIRRAGDAPHDYGAARVLMCGKSFLADRTGALYWPAEETLIVADLHLQKGSYLTEPEVLLPPYDTASAFDKLEEAIDRYDPRHVIALGDSFIPGEPLCQHDTFWLQDLMEGRQWFWVAGPDAPPLPEGIGGLAVPHVTLSGIKFRHEPVRAPVSQEIAGRVHPVASIAEHDYVMHGRCFVSNGMRLVMPSMGAYAAGLNVLDDRFDPLLGRNGLFVWVVSHGRVQQVASGQLRAG